MRSFTYVIDKPWRFRELRDRIDLQIRRGLAKLVMSGVPPHEIWMDHGGNQVVITAYGAAAAAVCIDFADGMVVTVVARYIGRWELLNA